MADERRSMLVAMATGTGKTKLAIAMLYRLLATKRFRRICFVVDRSALGQQTKDEFSTTKIVSGKTFADIFGLKGLEDVTPESETKVHICTIQGLVKRVLYAADASEAPPVDQYDLMVIDECHRGYLLDREMSDAELSFRGQDDYISKYRRVLEYFDAVKIGLTATPALHTTDIFGEPIFTYSYREAVIDGYLIDHEPPVRIETALARAGIELLGGRAGRLPRARHRRDLDRPAARRNPLRGRAVQQAGHHRAVQPGRGRGTGQAHRPCAAWQDADLRRDRRPCRHRGEGGQEGVRQGLRRDRRRGGEEDHRQRGQREDADPFVRCGPSAGAGRPGIGRTSQCVYQFRHDRILIFKDLAGPRVTVLIA